MCDLLEQKRFFLWPEIFPFVTICGQEYFALRSEQKRDVLWSGRVGTFCDVLWPETFCDRPFCGQDFFCAQDVRSRGCHAHRPFGSIL